MFIFRIKIKIKAGCEIAPQDYYQYQQSRIILVLNSMISDMQGNIYLVLTVIYKENLISNMKNK